MNFSFMFIFYYLLGFIWISSVQASEVINDGKKTSYGTEHCIFREKEPMPEELFNYWSGWGCYIFTPPHRFHPKYNLLNVQWCNKFFESTDIFNSSQKTIKSIYPCFQINETFYLNFDYKNTAMTELIESTFVKIEYFYKWSNCSKNADYCCKNVMKISNAAIDNTYCPSIWDGWSCIDKTPAGKTVPVQCPNIAYSEEGPTCIHYGSKQCFEDGIWNESTNYTECSVDNGIKPLYYYHITLLSISILVSIPAVIIFQVYYKLNVTRIKLHTNLIASIMLRNIFVICSIYYIIFDELNTTDIDSTRLRQNGAVCRLITFFVQLSTNWVFASMVLDGFYIYQLLVRTFDRDHLTMKYYFVFVAGLCIIQTSIWAVVMLQTNDKFCWIIEGSESWINNGLRTGMLVYNTILLVCIMKVLLEKVESHANVSHIRATAKALFILTPLFGLQFFITFYHFRFRSCLCEKIFFYVSYTFDGLQGFIVSLLYCFLNNEVQRLLVSSIQEVRYNYSVFKNNRLQKQQSRKSTETINTTVHFKSRNSTPNCSYYSIINAIKTTNIEQKTKCISNCCLSSSRPNSTVYSCSCGEQAKLQQYIEEA